MMKRSLFPVLFPACIALLAACSPTPSDRIAKNMPVYQQLPKEQQVKVARGELEKGMSPEAVLLAWGEPEQKMAGWSNGKNTERWIYTRSGTGWSLGLGGGGFRGRDSGVGTGGGVTMPLGGRPPISDGTMRQKARGATAFSPLLAAGLEDGFHQAVDIMLPGLDGREMSQSL